ncbi:RHS repeat-associated core domain-containing protein [Leptospira sp. 96542]|nr:RHS repeat-associated core domain-containing protein [Leptospira sp. 96542]
MITDGNGNVLAGGERGGKSHITYKPYGEILRTDSYGPDITKFKYTGQEEDRESGLYYYKARYYDAALGRFASNDGVAMPDNIQGLNRMMYVEGNPVAFVDPSGNNKHIHMLNRIIGHAMGKDFGSKMNGRFSSGSITKKLNIPKITPVVKFKIFNKDFKINFSAEKIKGTFDELLSNCPLGGSDGGLNIKCGETQLKLGGNVAKANPEEAELYMTAILITVGCIECDVVLAIIAYFNEKRK